MPDHERDLVSGVIQLAYSDKVMTVAPNQSGNEFVSLLYQAALGRAPDGGGLGAAGGLQRPGTNHR